MELIKIKSCPTKIERSKTNEVVKLFDSIKTVVNDKLRSIKAIEDDEETVGITVLTKLKLKVLS